MFTFLGKNSVHKVLLKLIYKVDLKTASPLLENIITQIKKDMKNFNNGNGNVYFNTYPEYLQYLDSSIRQYGYDIFEKNPTHYNSFYRDIAMVEIIYQKSTLVQIDTHLNMTWIDYFSSVGGLLGLVLGMGFFSFFELIWLCLRIISKKLNFTKWIE